MRAFAPVQPARDFDPRLYNILRNLNAYLSQVDAAFGNLTRGTAPDGSGASIISDNPVLDDYLYLPGRGGPDSTPGVYNGQTVFGNIFFKPYVKLQAGASTVAAWTSLGDFSTYGANSLASTTWSAIPIQTSASVGDILVLCLTSNPGVQSFGDHHSTLTDSQGNTWIKRGEKTRFNPASGGYGVGGSIWTCYVTTALTATVDTLTATFSVTIDTASLVSHRFSVGGNLTITVAGNAFSEEEGVSPLGPTALTISGLTSNPYLFVRLSASGTWNTGTEAFTPGGSDVSFRQIGAGSGIPGNRSISYGQYHIFTATGDTNDPATAETYGIFANIYLALQAGSVGASTDVSEHLVEVKAARDVADLDGFCIRDAAADGRLFFDGSSLTANTNRYWTIPNWTGIPVVPTALGTSGYLMVSQGTSQPAWLTVASAVPGAALSKVDDTNVTLALTGSPTVALLAATTLTLGWTGVLSVARGGTGGASSFTPSFSRIFAMMGA